MNLTDQFHHIQALTQAARLLIEAIEQGRDPGREIWKLKRVIRRGRVKRLELFDSEITKSLPKSRARVKPRRMVELSDLVAALEAAERIERV